MSVLRKFAVITRLAYPASVCLGQVVPVPMKSLNPAVRRVVEDISAEGIGTRLRDNWPLCAQNWREVCSGYASDTIFRADRFNRGGDHSSFDTAGFAVVRFTTREEDYAKQHKATDTFANSSPGCATRVTRVNGAALASLPWSQPLPQ